MITLKTENKPEYKYEMRIKKITDLMMIVRLTVALTLLTMIFLG